MTDHQSEASASQRFGLRRRPSSYHSADAHSREEAKRGAIAAVLGRTESFKGKYHYGLFANDTQSLSDAQAAFTHRLVELVCAQHAHGAGGAIKVEHLLCQVVGCPDARHCVDAYGGSRWHRELPQVAS